MSKPDLKRLGNFLVNGFQVAALFVIGATIVWSAATEYMKMMQARHARLDGILLLFISLELGTIVGMYFKTEKLPFDPGRARRDRVDFRADISGARRANRDVEVRIAAG